MVSSLAAYTSLWQMYQLMWPELDCTQLLNLGWVLGLLLCLSLWVYRWRQIFILRPYVHNLVSPILASKAIWHAYGVILWMRQERIFFVVQGVENTWPPTTLFVMPLPLLHAKPPIVSIASRAICCLSVVTRLVVGVWISSSLPQSLVFWEMLSFMILLDRILFSGLLNLMALFGWFKRSEGYFEMLMHCRCELGSS